MRFPPRALSEHVPGDFSPATRSRGPRVAIIGGGIFGATCAIELGRFCNVVLFERHAALMSEASCLNQARHHTGFHYPRSQLTVQEIKESRSEFMKRYGRAVILDFPSYYCTSAQAQEITAERYLATCRASGLTFECISPPEGLLAPDAVSLCLKTDEGVLDILQLRQIIEAELAACPSVRVRRGTEVIDGRFTVDGGKRLVCRSGAVVSRNEVFDYVVNSTYSNINLAAKWFQFPGQPLRFDLLELLVLELRMPPVSVTVLDGPFTTLVSMGRDNLFMLSHIHHSLRGSVVTYDGAPPRWGEFDSNRELLIRDAARYIPAAAGGRVVESRYGVRVVRADSENCDDRTTVITDHGFGCWSVLGGKIITCVHNAKAISNSIRLAAGA